MLDSRTEKPHWRSLQLDIVVMHRSLSYSYSYSYSYDYHSNEPTSKSNSIATAEKPFSTKGGVKMPFPAKLFHMLEYIDLYEPNLAKIISWQPHGRCFRTHDVKKKDYPMILQTQSVYFLSSPAEHLVLQAYLSARTRQ